MHSDRWGRSLDVVDDQLRYTFASATVQLKRISHQLSEISYRGQAVSREELRSLHGQLFETWDLVMSGTIFNCGPQISVDDTQADEEARDAHHDTYSDGTPVSIVVQVDENLSSAVPPDFCEGDIWEVPNYTGNMNGLDGPHLPPGCEVIVLDPPHKRTE